MALVRIDTLAKVEIRLGKDGGASATRTVGAQDDKTGQWVGKPDAVVVALDSKAALDAGLSEALTAALLQIDGLREAAATAQRDYAIMRTRQISSPWRWIASRRRRRGSRNWKKRCGSGLIPTRACLHSGGKHVSVAALTVSACPSTPPQRAQLTTKVAANTSPPAAPWRIEIWPLFSARNRASG